MQKGGHIKFRSSNRIQAQKAKIEINHKQY